MSDVSETAGELGISYDERSLAEGVLSNSQDELQITQRLCELLLRSQYGAAYLIANQQVAGGVSHPGTFLAQAIGALLYGSAAAAAEGRAALYKITDALSEQQQASFYSLLVQPVVPNLLGKMFYGGDSVGTLQLLDIVTAASPCLRPVFDLSASIEPVNLSAMRVRGAERARLINMLPAPPPHRRRRAVVAIRDLIFPQNPASRPHEAGPHIHAGLVSYGWNSVFCGLACRDAVEDYRLIAARCQDEQADLLLLDEQIFDSHFGWAVRGQMIAELRRALPSLQVVGVYLDAWILDPSLIREAVSILDAVWSPSPSQPVWQEATIAAKCIFSPPPFVIPKDVVLRKLIPQMFFGGAVMGYNWHRAFWLTAAEAAKLPIEKRLTDHASDGLPAMESSVGYMRELADATCVVNFSLRPDLSRIATGRSFETCLAGSLLVQEASPDMDYYFVAGEHYLEFTTFAELRAIARFLLDRPDEAEEIRSQGAAFARQRYNAYSIVGSLDRHLSALSDPN
jgi:hypothetical protein